MRRIDHRADPVDVGRRVAAAGFDQRHGHARDAGQQDLVERLLQRVEARHAQHRVDVPAEDDLHHRGRAFGDHHVVAERLGIGPQVRSGRTRRSSRRAGPMALYFAGQVSALRRQWGSSSRRRDAGTAATWSFQKADARATIVQPT